MHVLLTVGRVLNVQRESVDGRSHSVAGHVERPGQAGLDPDIVPRPEETPEHVCESHAIRDAIELVLARVPSQSQEDLLPENPLARRYICRDERTAGLQLVLGRVHLAVVSRTGIYGTAALVSEVCSRIAVGLGREEVDEGYGNGIDLGLLAVVQKPLLVGSLALDELAVSPALPLAPGQGTRLPSTRRY